MEISFYVPKFYTLTGQGTEIEVDERCIGSLALYWIGINGGGLPASNGVSDAALWRSETAKRQPEKSAA